MLSAYDDGKASVPVRATSIGNKNAIRNARESIAIVFLLAISLTVMFATICIFKFALRDKAVYEELVDYLDKTVSISKINYNPMLGLYELRPSELDVLSEQRKYKMLVWTFLFADLATLILFGISAFFYFSVEHSRGLIRLLFWFFLTIGILYSLMESTIFAVLISPHSAKLPNATISLLDHAIPYNPGGLGQMENRFGCIFDQNLYETFRRQLNPRNTCDPFLLSSFIPTALLVAFIVLRALAVLFLIILSLMPNSAISMAIAKCVARMKPTIHYKKKLDEKNMAGLHACYGSAATKTTFGVKRHIPSSPMPMPTQIPPATPPLGQMDHTINYNNAALFAISGANVNYDPKDMMNTGIARDGSRCSEISIAKCDHLLSHPDMAMMRGSTQTTNSLVSEV